MTEAWDSERGEYAGGLVEFVQTNVRNSGGLTQAVLEDALEAGLPGIYSRQFEAPLAEALRENG